MRVYRCMFNSDCCHPPTTFSASAMSRLSPLPPAHMLFAQCGVVRSVQRRWHRLRQLRQLIQICSDWRMARNVTCFISDYPSTHIMHMGEAWWCLTVFHSTHSDLYLFIHDVFFVSVHGCDDRTAVPKSELRIFAVLKCAAFISSACSIILYTRHFRKGTFCCSRFHRPFLQMGVVSCAIRCLRNVVGPIYAGRWEYWIKA